MVCRWSFDQFLNRHLSCRGWQAPAIAIVVSPRSHIHFRDNLAPDSQMLVEKDTCLAFENAVHAIVTPAESRQVAVEPTFVVSS